jgi:hypothetical protein
MSNQPTPNRYRGGKPREGERLRVAVSSTVSAETDDKLNDWLDQLRTVKDNAVMGRVLDRVVAFVVSKGDEFDVCADPKKGTP